jgi:hypothetical protein
MPDQQPPCCSSAGGAEEAEEEPELDSAASQSAAASFLQTVAAEMPQCSSNTTQKASQDDDIPASAHSGEQCMAGSLENLNAEQPEGASPLLSMTGCSTTPDCTAQGSNAAESASRASEQPNSAHDTPADKPARRSLLEKAVETVADVVGFFGYCIFEHGRQW